MANVTIPNLTSATTIAPSTDLMVLEQTNGTRKATLSQIFTSSATSGSGLGITSGGVYTIKSGLDSDISDINTLLGNTSIASIGDGTVTGAVSTLNSDLNEFSYKAGDGISITTNNYPILLGFNTTPYNIEFLIPLDKPISAENVSINVNAGYVRSNQGLGTLDISKLTGAAATKCVGGIRISLVFSTAQFNATQQMFAVTFNGAISFS